MKPFSIQCGRYRERLRLLTCGALTCNEQMEVEVHLSACPACQKYIAELRAITQPLTDWEKALSHLEPDAETRNRWARDFETATAPAPSESKLRAILASFVEALRPQRRIWAGFAAVWLAIFALNFSIQHQPSSSRPAASLVRALLESEGFIARTFKTESRPITSPTPPSTTIHRNRERS